MQEILLSFYVNIILTTALLYLIFKDRVILYIKNLKKKRRVAKASSKNLEKATIVRMVRAEVRRYLEELQK